MKMEEKRRKFHESLIHMLYPPPPSPPPQDEDDREPVNVLREDYDLNQIQETDELEEGGKSLSSDGDEDECGSQKLTRAQRKRLRKKKLSQAASRRRKVIGPLLPTISDDDANREADDDAACKNDPQDVRQNAPEKLDVEIDKAGESVSSTSQNKIKQRRMAKKLAKEKSKSSAVDNHDS